MKNIRSNENNIIEIISIEEIANKTCTIEELPNDFYQTFWLGKYLANNRGVYLNPNWLDPLELYKYFLIPTDFISYIEHYAGFVKEAFPQLAFNIICEQKDIIVEGVSIQIPTSVVNVIPCSVTHWTEEGLQVLEAVIGSWNNQNPTKIINIPYKFDSYNELISFRDANI